MPRDTALPAQPVCAGPASFAFPMDPSALAAAIDRPLDTWAGDCHGIATAIRDLVPVPGMRLARGHYTGFVARSSRFARGGRGGWIGPVQHSWLVAPDGRILDPTRWTLERPGTPDIYLGPCDVYDEGGRAMAAAAPPPFPGRGPDFSSSILALSAQDRVSLAAALELRTPSCAAQPDTAILARMSESIRRLAQRDPDELRDPATFYTLLDRAGLRSIVPIDSWARVMAPDTLFCRSANRAFTLPPAPRLSGRDVVARCLTAFCLLESRPGLEEELADYDITLEAYYDALTLFERWPEPFVYFPHEEGFILGVVLSDILGQGFGNALRVERYAASLGYPQAMFRAACAEISDVLGIVSFW